MGQSNAWDAGNGNLLLHNLSSGDRESIVGHLESVPLESRMALYDPDVAIEHVYFIDQGLVSVLGVFADGTAVETAVTGREGMVGMPVFHGANRIAEQAIVQVPGRARRLRSEILRDVVARSAPFRQALHHFSACMSMFTAQSVACMSKHATSKRLARWLLHASDLSGVDDLRLSHLVLSHMLGVRRSSVTIAASALRASGFITYGRQAIVITDRDGLAGHSCECYRIVRSTYDRLLFGRTSENPLAGIESSRDGKSILGSAHPERATAATSLHIPIR